MDVANFIVVEVLVLAALVLFAAVKLVRRLRGHGARICTACGAAGRPRTHTRGSLFVELVLWLLFVLPGLIYSLWRLSTRQPVCRACGNPQLIPLDSPRGRQLAAQYAPKTPAVE